MKDTSPVLLRKRLLPDENQTWLAHTQANILKSHGRDHVRLLMLQFADASRAAVILSKLNITSAWEQWQQTQDSKHRDETVLNCYLSYKGYAVLQLEQLVPHDQEAFRAGMAGRSKMDEPVLYDQPESWEAAYRQDIHAMIAIANQSLVQVKRVADDLLAQFGNAIRVMAQQDGLKQTNEHGQAIEHFGYADGLSQPLFFEKDFKNLPAEHWNPEATLDLALTPDFGATQSDCFGSYLVYRKLEQNVKSFKAAEAALADTLHFTGNSHEMAGALAVGRFENGLPAVKLGSVPSFEAPSNDNNFNYALDPEGVRCPFHAHIRKTNPRGDNQRMFGISQEAERSHRIVRRGITYGERDFERETEYPEGDVGLLFLCFQSSIENQFEFIQQHWANNNDFPRPFTGIDPIIGQGANRLFDNNKAIEQKWPKAEGGTASKDLSNFVTVKGGEYFFAPSLPFFQQLTNHLSA